MNAKQRVAWNIYSQWRLVQEDSKHNISGNYWITGSDRRQKACQHCRAGLYLVLVVTQKIGESLEVEFRLAEAYGLHLHSIHSLRVKMN